MEPIQPLNAALVESYGKFLGASLRMNMNMFEEHLSPLNHSMASFYTDGEARRTLTPLVMPSSHTDDLMKAKDSSEQDGAHGISNDSIRTEDSHTSEKSPSREMNTPSKPAGSRSKNINNRSKPASKRPPKIKSGSTPSRSEKKTDKTLGEPKKRQPRPRKPVTDEPVHQESIVVDNQQVVQLQEVSGDLEFEDLEPEDLEVVRYLPPPGNVRIVGTCAETLGKMREFERRLQDILHGQKDVSENDPDHDSDATLSAVLSDETQTDPSSKLSLDMAMLTGYKVVFDPPVPAVVTIPISTVQVRSLTDWETESKALQFLLKKPEPFQKKPPLSRKRKRGGTDSKRDDYVGRLIAAIEIKSNQPVHLKRPVFSLQQPIRTIRKPHVKPPNETMAENSKPTAIASSDVAKESKDLIRKLDLETLSAQFMETISVDFDDIQVKDLRKAVKHRRKLANQWNRNLLCQDPAFHKTIHSTVTETQAHVKRLLCGKRRAITCADEKYALDMDELEKRTLSNTEKAKSHVSNMFEENRRQYDLQRTLDFATCKCDMLAINTRNMRKRADIQPQYARLFEEAPASISNSMNPGSPPHGNQSSAPSVSAQNVKRRRTNFASTVRETLEEREIYDDLMMINRLIKEDPDRVKVPKLVEVVPDNNRLMIDGKAFHRNQEVHVEHFEQGKYSGLLVQFTQTEIMVKKTDGQRLKFPLGLVMDKKVILKKKSSNAKGNGTNNGK